MIDIHTHILPLVDDGASCFDEALDMVALAAECGVKALVATPHSNHNIGFVNYESDFLAALFDKLCRMLRHENIPIKLYRGMEIRASTDIMEKLSYRKLLTLNQTQYALVEFAFDEEPWWIEAILKELITGEYFPIIAHPERYACVQEEPNLLYEWRKLGAFAQMDKESVLGMFGTHITDTAELLLKHNLVNCLASDAHDAYTRTTDIRALLHYMEKKFSLGYWDLLMHQNPQAILNGKPLNMAGKFTPID